MRLRHRKQFGTRPARAQRLEIDQPHDAIKGSTDNDRSRRDMARRGRLQRRRKVCVAIHEYAVQSSPH
jgi:hypothetical protein